MNTVYIPLYKLKRQKAGLRARIYGRKSDGDGGAAGRGGAGGLAPLCRRQHAGPDRAKLGVSWQRAQRLVSLAVSEGLVKVRLDHPIMSGTRGEVESRFALDSSVVPSDPGNPSTTISGAEAAAEIEKRLRSPEPIVMAIGTGRTLKAAIEQMSPMDCPQHKIVSLTGNIAPDGSAAFYNVIFSIADLIKARSFPMPLPVIASSQEERAMRTNHP